MSKIVDFMRANKPTRFYMILKKWSVNLGRYSLELRLLRDESTKQEGE